MKPKPYFVLSFLMFGVLSVALGASWWISLTKWNMLWLAIPLTALAGLAAVVCFWMAVVAVFTTYRRL